MSRKLIALACILGLWSCGGSLQNTPESACKYFVEQLGQSEFEAAATVATPEMQRHLRLLHTEWKMSSESERQQLRSSLATANAAVSCRENDGVMECIVCCNSAGDSARFEMKQLENKWYVNQ